MPPANSIISFFTKIAPAFIGLAVMINIFFSCNDKGKVEARPKAYYQHLIDSLTQQFGYSKEAWRLMDSAFATYSNDDISLKFKYFNYACGYYHQAEKDETKAMMYADSMLLLIKNSSNRNDYQKEEAIANISKGDILFSERKYNDAYFHYYLGKVAAEKSLDPCTYSEYSYRLAMVMYKTRGYRDAAAFFKQAFEESASCKSDFGYFYRRQELLNNTALSYAHSGYKDSALLYYNKTLAFLGNNENSFAEKKDFFNVARGVIYGNMGQLYVATNYLKAEELFKKSIAVNSQPKYDLNDALLTQIHLAKLYYANKKEELLNRLLKDIRQGLDTIGNEQAKMDFNGLMWKVSEENNNLADAHHYLVEYDKLKDAEADNYKKLTETDISNEIKSLESEYQLQLLKKDNRLQNLYTLITVALFVMVVIIMILIALNWKRSRKNIITLTALNSQVNFQKEKLEHALELLELNNKEKDRIMQIVAHDLRNPIAGIHSLSSMMIEDYSEYKELAQMLELIMNGCNISMELITEILEIHVGDESRENQPAETVDINRIVTNCCKLLRFKALDKKQHLQTTLTPAPQYVNVNPSKIYRVLSNLITNAIKFSSPGKMIYVEVVEAGNNVQVIVQDEGIGIPEVIKNKLFEPSADVKRPGTDGEKPFGMGLSICKEILLSYHGSIWVETTVNKGSSFYISLPKKTVFEDAVL